MVALERELSEWEWVSTEEKLPPLRKVIIALCWDGTIRTMKWSDQDFVWVDCFEAVRLTDDLIVKWIPLPGQHDRENGNDERN